MPNMANITIKKADGTTDVLWTGAQASAGDNSPAIWQNRTLGTAKAHWPSFTMKSRPNGPGTARRVEFGVAWPQIVTSATGAVTVADKNVGEGFFVMPTNIPQLEVKEFAYQLGNLFASALIKACLEEGAAAT